MRCAAGAVPTQIHTGRHARQRGACRLPGRSTKLCVPRGAVAQLGERRVRNAKVRGSIPLSSTTFQRPTSIGWAFSFPGSPTPRGVPGHSACAAPHCRGRLNGAGSTPICPLFSQNLHQLPRRSARRPTCVPVICACAIASGCSSRLQRQSITQRASHFDAQGIDKSGAARVWAHCECAATTVPKVGVGRLDTVLMPAPSNRTPF